MGAAMTVSLALVRQERRTAPAAVLRRGVVRTELELGRLAAVEPRRRTCRPRTCRSRASRAGTSPRRPGRSGRRRCRSRPPSPMFAPERHERPEAGRVLGAAGVARRVVEVRQAEVVRVLVREHAEAAVLGLDRVVADPDAGRVVRDAAGRPPRRAARADVHARKATGAATLNRRVPAMAPDRVGALVRVARSLVAAGVDDLEVVDEAVRLVEVAVAVEVVAIPDVERASGTSAICGDRLARGQLSLDPVRHRVADQEPGVVADDAAAEVTAVARLVERHLDPAVHRRPATE